MLSCRAFPTPVTAVRTLADFTTTTIIINGELLTGCLKLTTQVVTVFGDFQLLLFVHLDPFTGSRTLQMLPMLLALRLTGE